MMTETPPKKHHYGFAQVPRMIIRGGGRFQQNRLSLVELGFYTGLKDICGESGECFYTLRNLASLLNTSASTISRHIPKLRDKKAIEAELKESVSNGHEVWHIRIVNVWKENDALYTPKQDCFKMKQSEGQTDSICNNQEEIVANCNDAVSICNNDCFILTCEEELDVKDTHKEESTYVPASSSSDSSEKETKPAIYTPEEDTLLSWLRIDSPREGKELKKHLQKMLPHVDTKEKAHDLFLHTQKLIARSDREDKTVSVGNMVEDWILNAWLQTQQTEPEPEQVSTPAPGDQIGMTKEQADEVKAAMLEHCPSLDPVIAISECDGVYTVGLAINETEWADIFTPTDWYHLPQDILDQCINYGEMIQQYEAIEIVSA